MSSIHQNIVIVCEDTYGLDVYMIIMAINARAREMNGIQYNVVGFISDDLNAFGKIVPPANMLGTVTNWQVDGDALYAIAIRNPERKKKAVTKLKQKGAKFETLVAPWVLLPFEYETGEGCIIANYSCKYKSKFGDYVIADTVMCESVEVGDYSTLCPFSNITSAKIGKEVLVGTHVAVMKKKTVGDYSLILPGSVVLTSIKQNSVVFGVPAKKIDIIS